MAADFIAQITEESELEKTVARPLANNIPEVEDWTPSAEDRCDFDCPAQALVKATGLYGELYMCSHHYKVTVASNSSANKLKAFAYNIQDKSDILNENRSQGANL